MDTKKLRQKILDLAIRGKLVPQDPNDEPASVLLERIRAEKERLIKEGKIKRSKKSTSDTPHYENDVPFEVPESWEWTTIGEITNYGNCENVAVDDIPWEGWILELEDLEKESAKIIQRFTKVERDIKGVRHSFHKGDVLYSKLRTYLNKVMVANEDGFCTTEIIPIKCMSFVLPEYLNHVLRSKYFVDYTIQCGYGVKMPRLSTTDACNGQIPLPPYNEQKHIVASIEGWFQIIDMLESNKADLDEAIQQAKSKILDLAIHGKLVPQDPDDEPAIELLKRINPSFVPCDNGHYENVPESWCSVPLENICFLNEGEFISEKKYPYIDVKGLRTGNYTFKQTGKYVSAGTTLILVDGENSGEVFHTPMEGYQGSTMKVLDINNNMNAQYVLYFVKLYQRTLRENKVGSAIPHLNKKMFRELIIPIPPIEEQKRIVGSIQQHYRILDNISANL